MLDDRPQWQMLSTRLIFCLLVEFINWVDCGWLGTWSICIRTSARKRSTVHRPSCRRPSTVTDVKDAVPVTEPTLSWCRAAEAAEEAAEAVQVIRITPLLSTRWLLTCRTCRRSASSRDRRLWTAMDIIDQVTHPHIRIGTDVSKKFFFFFFFHSGYSIRNQKWLDCLVTWKILIFASALPHRNYKIKKKKFFFHNLVIRSAIRNDSTGS